MLEPKACSSLHSKSIGRRHTERSNHHTSFTPQFAITNSITAALMKIERPRGFLDAAKLSKEWITGMQERALL